ncbi:hypothetical protein JTE90_019825 [Oedothorax gibbosus]|uniref:Caspase-8 n=1 Tax=Oedothorax gibbosus TaxID=931172 RepID=A0AAV6V8F9_9ARAC|nr:hypothetical protein JTE90_019825 [Oedothorax gibbosus]
MQKTGLLMVQANLKDYFYHKSIFSFSMDTNSSIVYTDAVPFYTLCADTSPSSSQCLDSIANKLDLDDYRSIFFLLMDFIGPFDFLYFAQQNRNYLKDKFLDRYYEFESHSRDLILIEIFGTMQRYDLLNLLGTCEHVYLNDKDTYNQVSQLWKCLFSVCDQLTIGDLRCYQGKLFPGVSMNVSCAEELLCKAYIQNIFHHNDLSKLKEVFKDRPDCSRLISSYTGSSRLRYYPIKRPTAKSPCGIAVILNHESFTPHSAMRLPERTGSSVDANSLKRMWESFGFVTKIHKNCTKDQVLRLFRTLSSVDHSSYDAFVVCYLSHGDEGIVYSSDSEAIKLVDLMDIMANKCPTLVNKPKLFFVQACSGRQVQQGVGTAPQSLPSIPGIEGQSHISSLNTPLYCDILLFYSSFPGFVSYRIPNENSWFIGELVRAMEQYGEDLTIMNVVTKVTDGVSQKTGAYANTEYTNCKQIPICSKTLKYELKLKKLLNLETHQ